MLWGIPGCSWPVWISAGWGEALNTHIVNVCRTALLVGVCKTFWSNWGVQKVANIVHVKIKSKTPWQQMKIIYGYLVNIARQYYPCVLVSGLSIYKLFCLQFAPSTTSLILSFFQSFFSSPPSLVSLKSVYCEIFVFFWCLFATADRWTDWNSCAVTCVQRPCNTTTTVTFCYCWQLNRQEQLYSHVCPEATQHYYNIHILLLLMDEQIWAVVQ